ncbi:hypothetical protein LL963_16570 [Xanthomonas campestris pv. esculenti]|nr:hypothetical protein [Xanthomonas campestris pv. esculenti]
MTGGGAKLAKQPGGRFRIIAKNGVNPSVYRTFNSASEAWSWVDAIDGARVLKGGDISADFLEAAYKSEMTGDGFQSDRILIGKILILERIEEDSKKVRYASSDFKFKNRFTVMKKDKNMSVLFGSNSKEEAVAMSQPKQVTRSVRKMKRI